MALAFSVVNVTRLCLDLGVIAWIAWLIGPSVDLSVIGLLTGIRFLSLHGYTEDRLAKLNRFLRFCGLLTLALNTAGALWHLQFGTAAGRRDRAGAADRLERDRPMAAARDQRRLLSSRARAGSGAAAARRRRRRDAGRSGRAAGPRPGAGRRAPGGDRQADLPRQPPRAIADRPGPGQRPGRRCPRRRDCPDPDDGPAEDRVNLSDRRRQAESSPPNGARSQTPPVWHANRVPVTLRNISLNISR